MIGSGKTTTAGHLGDWLSGRGEDVQAFHEGAADHPIRTRRVDELLGRPAPGGSGAYSASQWRRLAERCCQSDQTIILESVFLQNSVMPAFIDGAPAATVTGICTEIQRQAAPAEPFLLYLRPTDIAAAIARGPPDPRGAVVLAEPRLRGRQPLGPPPEPTRPGCRRPAVPGLGAGGAPAVPPRTHPQAHGARPATRLAGRPASRLRRRAPMTASARPNKTRPNLTMEEHRWQRSRPAGRLGPADHPRVIVNNIRGAGGPLRDPAGQRRRGLPQLPLLPRAEALGMATSRWPAARRGGRR